MTIRVAKAVGFSDEVKFNFYTYDCTGRDVVIAVWATDQDAAWAKFDRIYGKNTPVDMVRQEGAVAATN